MLIKFDPDFFNLSQILVIPLLVDLTELPVNLSLFSVGHTSVKIDLKFAFHVL